MKEKIFYSNIDMTYDSDDGKETIVLIIDWFMPKTEIIAGDYLEIINSNNESIEVKINSIKTKPNFCKANYEQNKEAQKPVTRDIIGNIFKLLANNM